MKGRSSGAAAGAGEAERRVLVLFGTRPEIIKLAPVVHALEARRPRFATLVVASGQHTDLARPFVETLDVRVDVDLAVGADDQAPSQVCGRVLAGLAAILAKQRPRLILVQGDTTTALAGALAGFYGRIAVGHVEAGLRSGDRVSPFPEEMNRRLITQLSNLHFAATEHNVDTLRAEGVGEDAIVLTGNPVVDSLRWALDHSELSDRMQALFDSLAGLRIVALTTHRRESFGAVMVERLKALRRFVEKHDDVALIAPVHPNPEVVGRVREELGGCDRIRLIEPLDYLDFIRLLANAWLIVSDSGGVQEEAPSLGKPVLVIRENTERPEAVEAGVARVVGRSADDLAAMLEECHAPGSWIERVRAIDNPFGRPGAGERIVDAIERSMTLSPPLAPLD